MKLAGQAGPLVVLGVDDAAEQLVAPLDLLSDVFADGHESLVARALPAGSGPAAKSYPPGPTVAGDETELAVGQLVRQHPGDQRHHRRLLGGADHAGGRRVDAHRPVGAEVADDQPRSQDIEDGVE